MTFFDDPRIQAPVVARKLEAMRAEMAVHAVPRARRRAPLGVGIVVALVAVGFFAIVADARELVLAFDPGPSFAAPASAGSALPCVAADGSAEILAAAGIDRAAAACPSPRTRAGGGGDASWAARDGVAPSLLP